MRSIIDFPGCHSMSVYTGSDYTESNCYDKKQVGTRLFLSMQSDSIGVDANISLMEAFTHNRPSSTSLNGTGTGLLTNVKRWRKFRKGLLPREKLFTSSCARITAFSLYGVKRQIKCLTLKTQKTNKHEKQTKNKTKSTNHPHIKPSLSFWICVFLKVN